MPPPPATPEEAPAAAAESRRLRTAIVWVLAAGALVVALLLAVPDLRSVGRRIVHMDAAIVGATVVLALLAAPLARRLAPHAGPRLSATLDSYARALGETVRLAVRPSWGLLGAFLYLVCDIGALWACAQGIGDGVAWASLSLSYQVAQLATWVPIPGAVGTLDGGMIGMLLVYGAPAATAAAAVLVYHALMFWIRVLLGGVAFLLLRRETRGGRTDTPYRR